MEGFVTDFTPNTIADERRFMVFAVHIKHKSQPLMVDAKPRQLLIGMGVSAEIITGKRRVIGYLWSPVAKAIKEAGREG